MFDWHHAAKIYKSYMKNDGKPLLYFSEIYITFVPKI